MGIFTEASRPGGCCGGWWCQLYRGEGARSDGDWVSLLPSFPSQLPSFHLPLWMLRPNLAVLRGRTNSGDCRAHTCAAWEDGLAGDDRVLRRFVHLAHLLALQVGSLDSPNNLNTVTTVHLHQIRQAFKNIEFWPIKKVQTIGTVP